MNDNAEPRPFRHAPVMLDEITSVFETVPTGTVADATVGGGGHSEAILHRRRDLRVLGLDRDAVAVAAAAHRLAKFAARVTIVHRRFDALHDVMATLPISELSGALFDLGVSSPQLDEAGRGFSYRNDGPIDMRMDPTEVWSADDVVNGYDEDELAAIIRRHGDERFAPRIAKAIVTNRPIATTTQLAAVVTEAIPAAARRTGGHPAKRTFQAIRIEVNGELDMLAGSLDQAIAATVPGGRIAVLSYHSGEDRIVADRFRQAVTGGCECPPELPCVCGAVRTVRIVRGVPKRPSPDEQASNPRARSARLRVVERIDDESADPRATTAERPERSR